MDLKGLIKSFCYIFATSISVRLFSCRGSAHVNKRNIARNEFTEASLRLFSCTYDLEMLSFFFLPCPGAKTRGGQDEREHEGFGGLRPIVQGHVMTSIQRERREEGGRRRRFEICEGRGGGGEKSSIYTQFFGREGGLPPLSHLLLNRASRNCRPGFCARIRSVSTCGNIPWH